MAKRLTDIEKSLRVVAYNEAIDALEAWKSDQNANQIKQADQVIKEIEALVQSFVKRVSPIGEIEDKEYESVG